MKTLNTIVLALGAAAVLGTSALHAETGVVARIPFDFTVQTVSLPAGEYSLRPISPTSGIIRIVNLDTHRSVDLLASSTLSQYKGKRGDHAKVIFHRYGDRYFFSEVWTPAGLRGATVSSKLEREYQADNAEKQIASVGARPAGVRR